MSLQSKSLSPCTGAWGYSLDQLLFWTAGWASKDTPPILVRSIQVVFKLSFNNLHWPLTHIITDLIHQLMWTQQHSEPTLGKQFQSHPDVPTNSKHSIKSCVAWKLNRTTSADPANIKSHSLSDIVPYLAKTDWVRLNSYRNSGEMIDKQEVTPFTEWVNVCGPKTCAEQTHSEQIWGGAPTYKITGTFKTRKINLSRPSSTR